MDLIRRLPEFHGAMADVTSKLGLQAANPPFDVVDLPSSFVG